MSLKPCILLLSCVDKSFCLKYKIWLNECPSACPYFQFGKSGLCDEYEKENVNVECIFLTRLKRKDDNPIFYCNLLRLQSPLCKECVLMKYQNKEEKNT